jgi:hypothetical protein
LRLMKRRWLNFLNQWRRYEKKPRQCDNAPRKIL